MLSGLSEEGKRGIMITERQGSLLPIREVDSRMEMTEKRRRNGIGWAVIAASAAILFTCGFLTALVGIDYGPHEQIALSLTPGDPAGLFREHPEPLWHLLTYMVVRLTHCRVEIAAGIVSGCLILLTYAVAYFAIRKTVPGLETHEIAALDLVLHLVSAIYVPFFNKEPFLGQGTPNIWHNPTTIAVRPIALLIFVITASMVVNAQKEEFEKGIPAGRAVVTALLLVLSCLAKPSFVQVFYPAIFTLMVIWLIMYKGKNLRTAIQLFLMCLPSLIVMIFQFVVAFYGGKEGSGGIMIAPFVVAGARTNSIAVSMLLLLAFPLLMLLIAAIHRSVTWGDIFGWIMLIWGTIWRLLLAEKGERTYHGNFTWGYMLAVYLVWYIAVRHYLKLYFSEQMTGNKRGIGFYLATLVLALHLISGIYYLIYLVFMGHGM